MSTAQKREPKVTREKAEAAANFMKILANPNRLMIACTLLQGEQAVGDLEITLGIRQPSLSQQLAELRESGIVEARREAKQVFYRIADQRAVALLATLNQIFCGQTPNLAPITPARAAPARKVFMEAAMFARVEPASRTA
jgi:DNA-binding transcriptional ArsR family regulator